MGKKQSIIVKIKQKDEVSLEEPFEQSGLFLATPDNLFEWVTKYLFKYNDLELGFLMLDRLYADKGVVTEIESECDVPDGVVLGFHIGEHFDGPINLKVTVFSCTEVPEEIDNFFESLKYPSSQNEGGLKDIWVDEVNCEYIREGENFSQELIG